MPFNRIGEWDIEFIGEDGEVFKKGDENLIYVNRKGRIISERRALKALKSGKYVDGRIKQNDQGTKELDLKPKGYQQTQDLISDTFKFFKNIRKDNDDETDEVETSEKSSENSILSSNSSSLPIQTKELKPPSPKFDIGLIENDAVKTDHSSDSDTSNASNKPSQIIKKDDSIYSPDQNPKKIDHEKDFFQTKHDKHMEDMFNDMSNIFAKAWLEVDAKNLDTSTNIIESTVTKTDHSSESDSSESEGSESDGSESDTSESSQKTSQIKYFTLTKTSNENPNQKPITYLKEINNTEVVDLEKDNKDIQDKIINMPNSKLDNNNADISANKIESTVTKTDHSSESGTLDASNNIPSQIKKITTNSSHENPNQMPITYLKENNNNNKKIVDPEKDFQINKDVKDLVAKASKIIESIRTTTDYSLKSDISTETKTLNLPVTTKSSVQALDNHLPKSPSINLNKSVEQDLQVVNSNAESLELNESEQVHSDVETIPSSSNDAVQDMDYHLSSSTDNLNRPEEQAEEFYESEVEFIEGDEEIEYQEEVYEPEQVESEDETSISVSSSVRSSTKKSSHRHVQSAQSQQYNNPYNYYNNQYNNQYYQYVDPYGQYTNTYNQYINPYGQNYMYFDGYNYYNYS